MSAPPAAGSAVVKDVKARRLVLFDVDGTLLSAGPSARTAFQTALEDVFGTSGDIDGYAFEGRLDPLIVTDLMRAAGVPDATIALRRGDALALYLDRLEASLRTRAPVLKPGVLQLLDALEKVPGLVPALLTGNVERGARVKLSAAGLWHRFVFGVWGDEAACREELGPIALEKARPATGLAFTGSECVVVGAQITDALLRFAGRERYLSALEAGPRAVVSLYLGVMKGKRVPELSKAARRALEERAPERKPEKPDKP